MCSSLDSIVAWDNIYDEGVLIKPTRKTDPLITPIFHGSENLAAVANSNIVLIELKLAAEKAGVS